MTGVEVTDPSLSFGAVLTIVGGVVGFMGGIIGMLASMTARSTGNVYRIGIETAKEQADAALAKNAELLRLHADDTKAITERLHRLEMANGLQAQAAAQADRELSEMRRVVVTREFLAQELRSQTQEVVQEVAGRFRETARTISDRAMPAAVDPRRDPASVPAAAGPMRPRLPSRGGGAE